MHLHYVSVCKLSLYKDNSPPHTNSNTHNNNGSEEHPKSDKDSPEVSSARSDPLDEIQDPKVREGMRKMQQLDRILAKRVIKVCKECINNNYDHCSWSLIYSLNINVGVHISSSQAHWTWGLRRGSPQCFFFDWLHIAPQNLVNDYMVLCSEKRSQYWM